MKVFFATSKLVPMNEASYPVIYHILRMAGSIDQIIAVRKSNDADLIIISPFIGWDSKFWFYIRISKLLKLPVEKRFKYALEKLYGVNKKFVFWSFENMHHGYWSKLGELVYCSNVPRVTSASKRIDPTGVRMPYWYNYVDFPFINEQMFPYERYGMRYDVDILMSPLKVQYEVSDACLVARNLNGIRGQIYKAISPNKKIDVFGPKHQEFPKTISKYKLLKKYKYYLATENSVGIGYETEKVPEAWISGCIPIGCIAVPDGDFNRLLYERDERDDICDFPLLLSPPCVSDIIEYVGTVL